MNQKLSKIWIDTHFHVFNAGEAVIGARYVPQYHASLSNWMTFAQSVGVNHGVLVQPSFLGTDNSLLMNALKAHPDLLRGVVVVSPNTDIENLHAFHALGVRGIRLNLAGISHDIPEWTRAEGVWHTLRQLGWHLEVHTDQGALPKVLAQLPTDMPLVIDHMGKPEEAQSHDPTVATLAQRAKHTATYVKLSGAYRLGGLDARRIAQIWLNELGPTALLWGSDWPCTNHEQLASYPELFASLEEWVGLQQLDQVMTQNPRRLYWDLCPCSSNEIGTACSEKVV